ncbi:MAG: lysophospholipid acyltransferase family protein [Sphingomonadaceae bacterium]
MIDNLGAAIRFFLIALSLLAGLCAHGAWRAARRPSPWPARFSRAVLRLAGVRTRIYGLPCPGTVLFLVNHLSWLDVLLIAGHGDARLVSKAEVADWPLIGWLARLSGALFVERRRHRGLRGQAETIAARLAAGDRIALFPEGTTGDGERLLPFRPALLAAIEGAAAPAAIQPVAIDYGKNAPAIAWGDESFAANAWRILSRRRRLTVDLRFLEPLDPARHDRKSAAFEARLAISRALGASEGPSDRLYAPQ